MVLSGSNFLRIYHDLFSIFGVFLNVSFCCDLVLLPLRINFITDNS